MKISSRAARNKVPIVGRFNTGKNRSNNKLFVAVK